VNLYSAYRLRKTSNALKVLKCIGIQEFLCGLGAPARSVAPL